jgi:uncharacterized membrane protein
MRTPGQRAELIIHRACWIAPSGIYSAGRRRERRRLLVFNSMIVLVAGLIVFLGSHGFTMLRGARAAMISKIGIGAYKALYAMISAVGLVLIIVGYGLYRQSGPIAIWHPPAFDRHITFLLMLFAFIFLAATNSDTHIRMIIQHPMLTAIKTWALAHLLIRGDLGSMLVFGSFLIWAVVARISLKRRQEPVAEFVPNWTSDAIRVVIGVVLYLAFLFWLHGWLIGVPLLPGSMAA